jgi:hypothetical protein
MKFQCDKQNKQTTLFEEIDVKILKINLNFKVSNFQIYHKSQINIKKFGYEI